MVGPTTQPDGQLTRRVLGRAGIALPAAITALAALSVLIAGVWVIVDLNAKTSLNRRSAMHALLVAEAGASHALGLTRGKLRKISFDTLIKGSDGVLGTTDDHLLISYDLTTDEAIPAEGRAFGGGTYFVTLVNDPPDPGDALSPQTDTNNRLLARCRGVMPDGASAEIQAVIGYFPYPALATEGKLKFGGSAKVDGACGGIHANGDLSVQGSATTVCGSVTASGGVSGGTIQNCDGSSNTPLSNQPPADIPELSATGMCTALNRFDLRADGFIDSVVAGVVVKTVDATGSAQWGWKHSISGGNVKWDKGSSGTTDGVFCINGNAYITGGGTSSDPWDTSIFATGSVRLSGNPVMQALDPSGALVVADGDVLWTGTSSGNSYNGLIYAGAQCAASGGVTITGQLLCKDHPNPAGSDDIVKFGDGELTADVSGNPTITFGCGGMLSKRKFLSWWQKLGS